MVQEPRPLKLPPWADPEVLFDFIDDLRRAGYDISLGEYATAQELLLALAARGESLDCRESFCDLLGPILCSSPTEQSELRERFARWMERRERAPQPATASPEIGQHHPGARRPAHWLGVASWWRLLGAATVGLGTGLLLALGGRLWIAAAASQAGALVAFGWLMLRAAAAGLVLVALAVAALIWRRRRADLYLVRRQEADGEVTVTKLPVHDLSQKLFQSLPFFRIAQDLRRREEAPSRELDVSATVAATVGRWGFLTPVFGTRQVLPEYLLLVDRIGFSDQQARLAEELADRLANQDVNITRYSFKGDPRSCFSGRADTMPLSLGELAARYRSHRLVLFSDGAQLFNPRTGELGRWTERFTAWARRSLLVPDMPEHWGSRERDLARLFTVLPATLDGLAAVGRQQLAGRALPRPAHRPTEPFPRELRDRPLRWLERSPPEPEAVERLLAGLRRFLGEPGLLWLAACAAYPEVDWGVTLFMGAGLDLGGEPLLDLGRLAALVRSPWLRFGFMPDWLRERLLDTLTDDQERSIREGLDDLLVSGLQMPADSFALEIAQHRRRGLARRILRYRAAATPEGGPWQDRVFLDFMRRPSRLAVPLPRELRARLGARRATLAAGVAHWRPKPERDARASLAAIGRVSRSNWTKLMIALSYLWALALVPLVVERKDPEVRWHALNGLVLFLAEVAIYVTFWIVGSIAVLGCLVVLVRLLFGFGILGMHVLCIARGLAGRSLQMPGISLLANRVSPWAPDAVAERASAPPSRAAVTAFVVSLLGITACGLMSPLAWYLGSRELSAIRQGRSGGGQSLPQAAKFFGIIGTILLSLAALWILVVGGMSVLKGR
jgi:uncharacterized membrane protein